MSPAADYPEVHGENVHRRRDPEISLRPEAGRCQRTIFSIAIGAILAVTIVASCSGKDKEIVFTDHRQALIYRCGDFKSQLEDMQNLRLILKEAKRYIRFLNETGRTDQGADLRIAIRRKRYPQVETELVKCLCAENKDQQIARKRWLLEDKMSATFSTDPESSEVE